MTDCKVCGGTGTVTVTHIAGQVFNMDYELVDVLEEREETCPYCHGTGEDEE